jgi:hypothetical protein
MVRSFPSPFLKQRNLPEPRSPAGYLGRLLLLQSVKILQEEKPRGLLGIVEFAGATGILPEDIVDIFEGLLEHGKSTSLG